MFGHDFHVSAATSMRLSTDPPGKLWGEGEVVSGSIGQMGASRGGYESCSRRSELCGSSRSGASKLLAQARCLERK